MKQGKKMQERSKQKNEKKISSTKRIELQLEKEKYFKLIKGRRRKAATTTVNRRQQDRRYSDPKV